MMINSYLRLGDLSILIHGEYKFREQQNVTEFEVAHCKPDIDIYIKKYQSINFDNFRRIYSADWINIFYDSFDNEYFEYYPDVKCSIKLIVLDKELKQAKIYIDDNYYDKYNNINIVESTPFLIMFMRIMLENNGILLHSAAIKENFDAGHIFCGVSDAGKTTISNLFLKHNIATLTDETTILRVYDDKIMIYGSPWKGSGDNIFKNDRAVLKQINFIYHCKENILSQIDTKKATEIMVKQAFPFFWEQKLVLKSFSIIFKILKKVPHYSFGFLPNKTSVEYYINYEKE